MINEQRQKLVALRRTFIDSIAEDVTGDGVPDYIYRTSGEGCASCHGQWVTIFVGNQLVFEEGQYDDPSVTIIPDHRGLIITSVVLGPNESYANASGRIVLTYRFDGGTFALTDKKSNIPPTANVGNAPPVGAPPGLAATAPPPSPTLISGSYLPGTWQPYAWTWRQLPMPGGVYFITDSGSWAGFWMQGSEGNIRAWFANGLLPYLDFGLLGSWREVVG